MCVQSKSFSFSAVADEFSEVLILGTMPGQASLHAQQYYAHPRNAFWPMAIAALTGASLDPLPVFKMPYPERIDILKSHRVALWDVLAQCRRAGSLDSAIERNSEVANPIGSWLSSHPHVQKIGFNGKAAEKLFYRHVYRPQKNEAAPSVFEGIEFLALPSTSPAMATLSLSDKFEHWGPVFQT